MSAELIAKDKRFQLNSPNNTLKVKVSMGDSITYSISFKNKTVILPSAIAMVLQNKVLGKTTQVNNIRVIKNKEFNELSVLFSDQNYSLIFRAYNEGVAYRFVTSFKDSIQVVAEKADFNINGKPAAILQGTDNYTSWEGPYIKYPSIAEISNGKRATTPALFDDKSNGIKVVIAESDLFGYPGIYIKKQGDQYIGDWAKFPTKTVMGSWGDFVSVVKERGDYLAKTDGSRSFPWRVIIATDNDKDLLNNHLVTKLARPSEIKDTSWIKSGKAAWEWWHDAMLLVQAFHQEWRTEIPIYIIIMLTLLLQINSNT
ncbi:glycoside hydrolase family 97 N-terminal domain-containing protein [Pedobacter panaciterrae]